MIEGTIAVIAAVLSFLVPLAIPLFAQRWRTFAVVLALAGAFFGWLNWDIGRGAVSDPPAGGNLIGPFLGGLMLFGFGAGAIAKFVMLLGRHPTNRA